MIRDIADRIAGKFEIQESGCWMWTASLQNAGYGQFGVRVGETYIPRGAHRVMYELTVGPIPAGMDLDHICHTEDPTCFAGVKCPHRRCVNPDHLEPVTRKENARRGRVDISGHNQSTKTHCPQGHPYSPENTQLYRDGKSRRCRTCARAASVRRRLQQKEAA